MPYRIVFFNALGALALAGAILCALPQSRLSGPLAELHEFKRFTAARQSSYDTSGGNADGGQEHPIAPGETRTLTRINGPGAIADLWCTFKPDVQYDKNLILRMHWDGETLPSVEAQIGVFFGLGHGKYYE
jgi:hypothetical protein